MEYDSDLPILGFRRWKLKGKRHLIPEHSLIGSWRETIWPVDEPIVAECLPYNYHSDCNQGPLVDRPACKCGLHLWFSMSDAQDYNVTNGELGYVVGIAAGGGRVFFDARYARCEVAEPVALIHPSEYGPQFFKRHNGEKWVDVDETERIAQWAQRAANRYSIPMLSLWDAMAHAAELGVWIDGVEDLDDGEAFVKGVDNG